MRIHLNLEECLGYGNCVVEAPDLFDLDEDTNKAIVLIENPDDGQLEEARAAVRSCPAAALRLER
ncbi:ferredoxin [Ornithinimicrobium murale]|uniref:ferredoxin n=1 Tax=Ornithinimicrobium murale TaxID=1050153 RepID=UPI00192D6B72|nr:ferredoxin [Ornithinimicrobium murale]